MPSTRIPSLSIGDPPLQPTGRELRLVLGYAATIITVYFLAIGDGWLRGGTVSVSRRLMTPVIFPILYLYTPPLIALYNELRGGSIGGSLLLGATPGLTFPVLAGLAAVIRTGSGDAPAWVLTVTYVGIGAASAACVICLVRSLRLALDYLRH
jgi:hypothetical protein